MFAAGSDKLSTNRVGSFIEPGLHQSLNHPESFQMGISKHIVAGPVKTEYLNIPGYEQPLRRSHSTSN
jgi:hypothetical protein